MESIEISANPVVLNHEEIIPDEVFKKERVTIDHLSNNFSITSKYGISLYLDHPVDMTWGFDDSEVYLIRTSGEEIKVQSSFYIQSSYISCSDYYQNYTDKYVSISIPEFADRFDYLPYSIDLNLNHVSHAEARASGDVYFSYTPNGKEYELRDQNIQVSGKNELEMSLHYDNKVLRRVFLE